jgi:phosphoribosyl-AMP cyclohydrolase / phosphoribosyl-ATP pyrophosphohydrolase
MSKTKESSLFNWNKSEGLIPTIVQDQKTKGVLMLGYMNEESFLQTIQTKRITFYSRAKKRIWVKGESSGNYLDMTSWQIDCDKDTLLFQALPRGPVCHLGTQTCFGAKDQLTYADSVMFLTQLEDIISKRFQSAELNASYVKKLFDEGLDRIAQKVGEEAIETVIAAKNDSISSFENEVSDLIFHILILMRKKQVSLIKICKILENRHNKNNKG